MWPLFIPRLLQSTLHVSAPSGLRTLRRSLAHISSLLLGIGLPLTAAPALASGVDLSVNACPSGPGVSSDAGFLDCANAQPLILYVTFQPAEPIPDLIGITGHLRLIVDGNLGSGATFWDFENVNAGALSVTHTRPSTICNAYLATWSPPGSGEGFAAVKQAANIVDITFIANRPTPIAVTANQRLFGVAIVIDLSMSIEAGGNLLGCSLPVCAIVDCLQLFSESGAHTTPLSNPAIFNNIVTINGGSAGQCAAMVRTTVYRDADGDGYGNPLSSLCVSSIPSGYVTNNVDCNDANPAIHPGATDSCNGIDDDCDGRIDQRAQAVGLVGWWPGNDNAIDYVAGNNGTLQNGAGFAAGKVGDAFSLDGVDDYIAGIGTAATFSFIENTGIFTIEGWIKLNDPTAIREQAITAHTGTTIEKGHYFTWNNSTGQQLLNLALMKGESGNPVIVSASPSHVIMDSDWHHVAAVGNGSQITFYVDGTEYPGSGAMGSKPTGNATRAADIGHCPGGSPQCQFSGKIDELAFYDRALSATEIHALYAGGSGGRCALVGVDELSTSTRTLQVSAPRPNPASRDVELEFQLPQAAVVHARVVDIAGRWVSLLLDNQAMSAGAHRLHWDGHDASGRRVAPGTYLVRITAGSAVAFQKIVIIQ